MTNALETDRHFDFREHATRRGIPGIDQKAVRRQLTYVKATVSSKGQIVLPAELRLMDRIEAGQEFDVERLDRGDYRLIRRSARPNDGALDWLVGCPEKGFFVPAEAVPTACGRSLKGRSR